MRTSQGIDYAGFSQVNRGGTGIRYGVISCNSLGEFWHESIEYDYGTATCPKCGNDAVDPCDASVTDKGWNDGKDYACLGCEYTFWSDNAFSDEPLGWTIDDAGIRAQDCLDNDAMVTASPYFTYAAFCSPCVPGACSLDSPLDEHDKTTARCYCFGHDWFDGGTAPYPVYSVTTGKRVVPKRVTTPCPNCNGTGADSIARLAKARSDTVEHTREMVETKVINVRDYAYDSFLCFRCNGRGTETAMAYVEVQS